MLDISLYMDIPIEVAFKDKDELSEFSCAIEEQDRETISRMLDSKVREMEISSITLPNCAGIAVPRDFKNNKLYMIVRFEGEITDNTGMTTTDRLLWFRNGIREDLRKYITTSVCDKRGNEGFFTLYLDNKNIMEG